MAERLRLIFLDHSGDPSEFTSPSTGGGKDRIPRRDRYQHSIMLRQNLDAAWQTARKTAEQRTAVSLPTKQGIYLEFESAPEYDLVTKSLEDIRCSWTNLGR